MRLLDALRRQVTSSPVEDIRSSSHCNMVSPPDMNCDHRVIAFRLCTRSTNHAVARAVGDDVTHRLRQRCESAQRDHHCVAPATSEEPRHEGPVSHRRRSWPPAAQLVRRAAGRCHRPAFGRRGLRQSTPASCWSVCSTISIARRRFGAPSLCSTEATCRRTVTCEIPRRMRSGRWLSRLRRRWKTSNSRRGQLDLRLVRVDEDATPHPALAKLQDQARGHRARQGGLALRDAADCMRKAACRSAHQQISVGAGPQRLEQVLITSRPGHHHDLRVGERLLDQPRDLDPARPAGRPR